MGLLDSLIITSCIGLSGNAQDACNQALIAGAKQSGIEQNVNEVEKKYSSKADREARELLGNSYNFVGSTVFVAKSISDKAVTLGLPTFGLCNSLKAKISDNPSLNMEWKF